MDIPNIENLFIYDTDGSKKLNIDELREFFSSLGDAEKIEMLSDVDLITNKLHFETWLIAELISSLPNEDDKRKLLKIYSLEKYFIVDIVNTFSTESKIKILREDTKLSKYNKMSILRYFDIESLCSFFANNRDFLQESDIHPYEIVSSLKKEQQEAFITKIENIGLSQTEKLEILAMLAPGVKRNLDTTGFSKEYKTALSIATSKLRKVLLDLDRNLEDYRGLDNLIDVNPAKFSEKQKEKFMQLCDICPGLHVLSAIGPQEDYSSSVSEYKEAEKWIDDLINSLDPTYSDAQKLAVIDNAIGKKISYSPDFDTEVFDDFDCRALWKIISSGYGVCNGISTVEQYILGKVGIESELVSGKKHAFLKIKNIELPLANGETVRGDTIVDPTWNLSSHRFNARPNNFCINYEQARKNDVDKNGEDRRCHKNKIKLEDVTLMLDDQSLRNLFTSVGLADKNGQFPVKSLIEQSAQIDEEYANQPSQNVSQQLLLLSKVCPEFATCQRSSMRFLSDILLNNKNLIFNRCVVNRVYRKTDKNKRPILFVYIDSNEIGQKFYFADSEIGQFIELPQEEFKEQFECYERDKKNRT